MPLEVFTAQQMRSWEQTVIEGRKLPSLLLMENAARAVADVITADLPPCNALVLCGPGNNGGDGFALARQLAMQGFRPVIATFGAAYRGDAQLNLDAALELGIPHLPIQDAGELAQLSNVDCIVDALFGTGLTRPVEGLYLDAVRYANACHVPVYSVDLPSGIDATSGALLGEAVTADKTVTFQHAKRGHFLYPGRDYVGELVIASIAPPVDAPMECEVLLPEDLAYAFPPRPRNSHKGSFGHALLIAGSVGFSGAATISALAAVRSGAGLVSLGVAQSVSSAVSAALPEVMTHPLPDDDGRISERAVDGVKALLSGKRCVGIGPGLGTSDGLAAILRAVLEARLPCVIDADALTLLASHPELLRLLNRNCILTPHPGEMARLCGLSKEQIAADMPGVAQSFAKENGCIVHLKGATSVTAAPMHMTLGITGNPALAKGGSGDALTGITLALLSQGLTPYNAVRFGALLLGCSADALPLHEASVLASDVINNIPATLRSICDQTVV